MDAPERDNKETIDDAAITAITRRPSQQFLIAYDRVGSQPSIADPEARVGRFSSSLC